MSPMAAHRTASGAGAPGMTGFAPARRRHFRVPGVRLRRSGIVGGRPIRAFGLQAGEAQPPQAPQGAVGGERGEDADQGAEDEVDRELLDAHLQEGDPQGVDRGRTILVTHWFDRLRGVTAARNASE